MATDIASDESEVDQALPIIQGFLNADAAMKFWCSADLPGVLLEYLWDFKFTCQWTTNDLGPLANLQMGIPPCIPDSVPLQSMIVLSSEGELTTVSCTSDKLRAQTSLVDLPNMYDAFGDIQAYQEPDNITVVLQQPLRHAKSDQALRLLLTCLQHGSPLWTWTPASDCIRGSMPDCPEASELMAVFSQVLPLDDLKALGGESTTVPDRFQVLFQPCSDRGVCPPNHFALCLSVAASRMVLDGLQELGEACDVHVRFKLLGRPLWTGWLPGDAKVDTLLKILAFAAPPAFMGNQFRLLKGAQRIMPEVNLRHETIRHLSNQQTNRSH